MLSKINYKKVVEDSSEIDFYKEIHRKILEYLSNKSHVTFWDIVKNVGGSDRRVLRLLNQMQLAEEIKLENGNISAFRKINRNIIINFTKIRKVMSKIYKKKPNPTFLYDQRPVTIDTTVNRVEYMFFRGDLIGKHIVMIGDDDLTSLALGFTRQVKEVVVLDIDKRLIEYINEIAKKEKLNVKAYTYDFTLGVPKKLLGKFDIFLTDPTPKPESLSLFSSVGLSLLKKGKGFVGYVSFFPSHQEISIDFQKIFTDKRIIITDMIPKFTQYDFIGETYNSEDVELLNKFDSRESRVSFTENLTRIETTEDTIKEVDVINKKIKNKMLGKATKRVLNHVEKDPAYIRGESNFVLSIVKEMRRKQDE